MFSFVRPSQGVPSARADPHPMKSVADIRNEILFKIPSPNQTAFDGKFRMPTAECRWPPSCGSTDRSYRHSCRSQMSCDYTLCVLKRVNGPANLVLRNRRDRTDTRSRCLVWNGF